MLPTTIQNRLLNQRQQGSVLFMVLVVVIIMSLTTSTFLLLMRNEHIAARYSGNRLQTELLAQSGIDYLRVLLAQTPEEILQQGGLLSNPDRLQDVLVIDDPVSGYSGRFTVLAPDMSQGYYQNLRYGLENESAKLNLNTLLDSEEPPELSSSAPDNEKPKTPRDRLLHIPGMNEAVADAILDWIDDDDSPRDFGAEASYYLSLSPPYQPRNGPLTQLDDLLMIRGVTTELLYGLDVNRNYTIDDDEQPRGALSALDNTNGEMNRGWSAYLTVHSAEKNVGTEGEAKINLNDPLLESLHRDLQQAVGPAEANFLIAYRQYGPAGGAAGGEASGEVVSASGATPDFEKEGDTKIESVLDLIDARVLIKGEEGQPSQILASPWKDDPTVYQQKFAELLDVVTTDSEERTAGRININQASLPVLLTIPGITASLADQILAERDPTANSIDSDQRHPTWLLANGLVTLEEFKPMLQHLTTGGDVFSGQVVGFFDAGTARARGEVWLDRSGEQTRLLDWRDLSPLGPGFSRSVLSRIVESEE